MARHRRARALRVLRGAGQHRPGQRVSRRGHPTLEAALGAAARRHAAELEADATHQRSMATSPRAARTPSPTRASTPEPKAGAQCVRRARWDLRGGRPATAVPTAIASTASRSPSTTRRSPGLSSARSTERSGSTMTPPSLNGRTGTGRSLATACSWTLGSLALA